MTRLAFPSVPDTHHWIEDGLASYVESIARAQAGQLSSGKVWAALVAGLPKGLPRSGDRGLEYALRAILAAGNMESSSAIEPLLEIGYRAVGVPVLAELYPAMKDSPAPADPDALWRQLAVRRGGRGIRFDENAPEAAIRRAITAPL